MISDQPRARMSDAQKNRTKQHRINPGLAHKGKTISNEMKTKQSLALSGENNPRALEWIVEYEDQRPSERVKALKSWCKERSIKYTSLYMRVVREDHSFYEGIRVRRP